jgi:hypothetical protein
MADAEDLKSSEIDILWGKVPFAPFYKPIYLLVMI